MDFSVVATVATAVIALYAAGLSTWNAIERRHDRRVRIKVTAVLGVAADVPGYPNRTQLFTDQSAIVAASPHTVFFIVSGQNTGQREASLGSLSFRLPDNTVFIPNQTPIIGPEFPCDVSPGKACIHCILAREFARNLLTDGFSGDVQLIACYTDQLGKHYRSKPFVFDVNTWGEAPAASA